MTGTQLLSLQGKIHLTRKSVLNRLSDSLSAVTNHHHRWQVGMRQYRVQGMQDHGFSKNGVQHFGQSGFHARAHTCSQ